MQSWMRQGWTRHAALMLVLAFGAGLVAVKDRAATHEAGTPVLVPGFALEQSADDDTTGSIGTVGVATRDVLPLDNEQLSWIFLGVINLPDVPEEALAHPAAALPATVALYELPAMVTRKVPQVKGYMFAKLEDRILLVRPESRTVVAQIPRYKLLNP
jgi:hypothetical protein